MSIELLLWMIASHFFGDYALQSDWIAINKCKSLYVLLAHTVIWVACLCVPLYVFAHISTVAFALLCLHFFIDLGKCRGLYGLGVDQSLHFLQIGWVLLTLKVGF